MHKIGIDLGSSYTKGVVVDEEHETVDYALARTGLDFKKAANKVLEDLSKNHEIVYPVYTCGYGREELESPSVSISEITALAAAVYSKYKRAVNILDIGGQDTTFIELKDDGQVGRFKMNRKCAAGTGSFLEEIAFRLDVDVLEFNSLAREASQDIKLNSFCTVFAVTEIVGLIKQGVTLPGIAKGVYNAIIERCKEMAELDQDLVLTGGIPDRHPAFVDLFNRQFSKVTCPEKSQFLAAHGCVIAGD